MLDMEAPVITISPESVREHVSAGRLHSFVLEVLSTNGVAIKGICFSDHPAIRADIPTFTGRRVHVSMRVDATGMQAGDIIVEVNGTVIATMSEMTSLIGEMHEGDEVRVKVFRPDTVTDAEHGAISTSGNYVDLTLKLAVIDPIAH